MAQLLYVSLQLSYIDNTDINIRYLNYGVYVLQKIIMF